MSKVTFEGRELGVFRRLTQNAQQSKNQHNPFGISFKGRILTSDVFETSQIKDSAGLKETIAQRGKLYASAVVGSLNNAKNSIQKAFAPVIAFTGKIGETISNTWTKLSQTEVNMPSFSGIFERFQNKDRVSKEVRNLATKPVSELTDMLRAELAV